MSEWQAVAAVLLAAACLASGGAWALSWPRPATVLTAVLLGLAAAVAAVQPSPVGTGAPAVALLVTLAGALAVSGGGPVTVVVFGWVDGPRAVGEQGPVRRAGEVLRGGAWIGALERAGVFATLLAGWPEGMAVVLGLKGLGRYQELQWDASAATAERFIIGTFTSVLWAAACAAVAFAVT